MQDPSRESSDAFLLTSLDPRDASTSIEEWHGQAGNTKSGVHEDVFPLKSFLKISRWWDYQLAVMLALVYQVMARATPAPPLGTWLLTFALFVVACIGIAGFGHLVNDFFDLEQDLQIGARSLVANRSRSAVAGMFVLSLLLAWLPWIWLPTTPAIWALLILEFVLFIAYSIPGIRLKERGLLGPVADALYSYTISTMVAMLVFAKLGGVELPIWICCVTGTWSFLLGLRQILTHQMEDVARDQLAGMKTFVTIHGWPGTFHFLERVILPAEFSLFLVMLFVCGLQSPVTPIGFLLYAAWVFWRRREDGIWQEINPWKLPPIDRLFFFNLTVLHRFYTRWFPLLALVSLVSLNPVYIVVAVLHLFLFNNGLKILISEEIPELRRRWRAP